MNPSAKKIFILSIYGISLLLTTGHLVFITYKLYYLDNNHLSEKFEKNRAQNTFISLRSCTKSEMKILEISLIRFKMSQNQFPMSYSSRYINDATAYIEMYIAKGSETNFLFQQEDLVGSSAVVYKDTTYPVETFKGDATLLKPTGILGRFPYDYCDPNKNGYRYFSDGQDNFIIVSNGPDGDIDIDEHLYDGDAAQFQNQAFNISNGLESNGDFYITDKNNSFGAYDLDISQLPLEPYPPIQYKVVKSTSNSTNQENQQG